ncbi:MAG: DUF1735 domain-containing protein [Carboxylicivirga sp.]|nr:DUF1735 domain-containing protein [Carboxylicivirga sp.]
MKSILNQTIFVLLFCTVLIACSEDETYIEPAKVYVNTEIYPVNRLSKGLIDDKLVNSIEMEGQVIKFGVNADKVVTEACEIRAKLDTSLLAAYNEKNSSDFKSIDEKYIDYSLALCHIKVNERVSFDSIQISLKNADQLNIEDPIVLPFRIYRVSGNVNESTNLNSVYVTLNKQVSQCNLSLSSDIVSNLVDNVIDYEHGKSFQLEIESEILANKDVTIELVVDPELLAEYNEEHESEYKLFSKENYTLSSTSANIQAGSNKPTTPISIEFKNENNLEWGSVNIIPLRMKVSVDGKVVNNSDNSAIIKVRTKQSNLVLADNESQIGGSLIDTENAEISGSNYNFYRQAASALFDQDISKGWISSNGAVFTVDLNVVKTLKGFAFKHDYLNYASYGSIKDIEISVSTDNTNWTSLGEVTVPAITKDKDNPITHYVRCVASEAQYIKIAFPRTYGSYVGLSFIGMYE